MSTNSKKDQFAYNSKSRVSFWQNKFKQNIKRDKIVRKELSQMGWQVYVIWECETKKIELLEERIEQIFSLT